MNAYYMYRAYYVSTLHYSLCIQNLLIFFYPLLSLSFLVVYPSYDILDGDNGRLIKGSNVVGAFTWGLDFIWEDASVSNKRVHPDHLPSGGVGGGSGSGAGGIRGKGGEVVDEDTLTTSPAIPPSFAITTQYYSEIGGLHAGLGSSGLDTIELSIRIWTCGGSILRQPCSRIAVPYTNLHKDTYTNIRKDVIDNNVIKISEQWLDPPEMEYVYMSRFLTTIPYQLPIPVDARNPKELAQAPVIVRDQCSPFTWYMKEIYPGLLYDKNKIKNTYINHISTTNQNLLLKPLLQQYNNPPSNSTSTIQKYDQKEINRLKKRSETVKEQKTTLQHKQLYIPILPPIYQPISKEAEKLSLHYAHEQYIQDTLTCEDENFATERTCSIRAKSDLSGCKTDRSYMMFGCPKTCGLCGIDNKICFDFYENKCPIWKSEGKCESEVDEMRVKCRYTCGACIRTTDALTATSITIITTVAPTKAIEPVPVVVTITQADVPPIVVPILPKPPAADPYISQRKYSAGLLPDPTSPDPCKIAHTPDGQLLDRISLYASDVHTANPNNIKLFCGIYTTASKHQTNVKATGNILSLILIYTHTVNILKPSCSILYSIYPAVSYYITIYLYHTYILHTPI